MLVEKVCTCVCVSQTYSLNALWDHVDGLKVHSCVSVLWKLAPGVGIFNLPVELTNCKRKNHDLQHPLKAMFWKACIKLQFSLPLEHRYYTTGVVCSYNYSTVVRRHNSDSVLVLLAYMQEWQPIFTRIHMLISEIRFRLTCAFLKSTPLRA